MFTLQTPNFPIDTFAGLLEGKCPPEVASDFLSDHSLPLVDVLMLYARDREAVRGLQAEAGTFPDAVRKHIENEHGWHGAEWGKANHPGIPIRSYMECAHACGSSGAWVRVEMSCYKWRVGETNYFFWAGQCEKCKKAFWSTDKPAWLSPLLDAAFPLAVLRCWLETHGDKRHEKLTDEWQEEIFHEVANSRHGLPRTLYGRPITIEEAFITNDDRRNFKHGVLGMFEEVGIWGDETIVVGPVEVVARRPKFEPLDVHRQDYVCTGYENTLERTLIPSGDPGFSELVIHHGWVTWERLGNAPEPSIGELGVKPGIDSPFRIRPHKRHGFAIDRMIRPVEFLPKRSPWLSDIIPDPERRYRYDESVATMSQRILDSLL